MTRRKVELLFIVILLALSLILFKTAILYKGSLFEHPLIIPLFSLVSFSFILFNYWFLKLSWLQNILYSVPIIFVSLILAYVIISIVISIMLILDEGMDL